MPAYKDTKRNTWFYEFKILVDGDYQKLKKRGFNTKKEALAAEYLKKKDIENNIYHPEQYKVKFEELAYQLIQNKKNMLKPSSYTNLLFAFEKHLIPYFKGKLIKDIKLKHIENWKNKISNERSLKTGNPYSIEMLNTLKKKLSSLFRYAIKHDLILKNPVSYCDAFVNPNNKPKEMKIITLDEFNIFIDSFLKNDPYYLIFNILFFTGIRVGELQGLQFKDIDYLKQSININKSIDTRIKGVLFHINTPKTKSSIRSIKLPVKIFILLKKYHEYSKNISDFNDKWFLFGFYKVIPNSTLEKKKNDAFEKINIPKIRIHDFRHSHASLLINNNANIKLVSSRLGHIDVSMTLNTYSHLYKEKEDEVVKLINLLI